MKADQLRTDKKRVTINDVAHLAGVVPSTVSHVLNQTASISEETRSRVLRAVEELNYSPNASARALRQKRTRLIGVAVQDISSEFYARCAASILEEARKDCYCVLLCDAAFDKENLKKGVMTLIERRVDGLIFIGGGNDEEIIREAQNAGVPIIMGDRHFEDFPSVEFDNRITVRKLVKLLWKAGYQNYTYASEPTKIQGNLRERYEGFLEGLRECGASGEQIRVVFDERLHKEKIKGSFQIFENLISQTEDKEGTMVYVTSNDLIAYGILAAAEKKGIPIPGKLAVVGFDNIQLSEYYVPGLTTIAQDEKLLGRNCYQLFKKVIHGQVQERHIVLEQQIIGRESAILPLDGIKESKGR